MPRPLPVEVQETAIDHLWYDISSLRKCSLVCRRWVPRSRCHLLYVVRIEGIDDLRLFYAALEQNPSLCSYIRIISMSPELEGVHTAPRGFMEVVPVKLFTHLPHLCGWRMHDRRGHEVGAPLSFTSRSLSCLKTFSGGIRTLDVAGICFSTAGELFRSVAAFKRLEDLRCTDISFARTDSDDHGATYLLRSLQLTNMKADHIALVLRKTLEPHRRKGSNIERVVIDAAPGLPGFLRSTDWHDVSLPSVTLKAYATSANESISSYMDCVSAVLRSLPRSELTEFTLDLSSVKRLRTSIGMVKDQRAATSCYDIEEHLLPLTNVRSVTVIAPGQAQYHRVMLQNLFGNLFPRLFDKGVVKVECSTVRSDLQTTNHSHDSRVTALAISSDAKWVATGSEDWTLILWDNRNQLILWERPNHQSVISCVAFSPNGEHLASGAKDLFVWDVKQGSLIKPLPKDTAFDGRIVSCIWSPDGTRLIAGIDDRTIRIWDVHTYQQLHSLPIQTSFIPFLLISRAGDALISCGRYRTCRIFDFEIKDVRAEMRGHRGWVTSAALDAQEEYIATGSDDMSVRVWRVDTGEQVERFLDHGGPVRKVAFSPRGRQLLSVADEPTVTLWNSFNEDDRLVLRGHSEDVHTACFSPDGKYVATGSKDTTVRLWSAADGQCLMPFTDHRAAVRHVAFSSDGELLCSGADDGSVCVRRLGDILPFWKDRLGA